MVIIHHKDNSMLTNVTSYIIKQTNYHCYYQHI